MKTLMFITLLLTGCANMPTNYGDIVTITDGPYRGMTGKLIGDCSGFENYRVKLLERDKTVCVRSWNMEGRR